MKDRIFWILLAIVLIGLFFLLPAPIVDSITQYFTG